MKIILLIFFGHTVTSIQNDSPIVRECPRVRLVQSNISINLIEGIWYEISKHFSSFTTGSCISINLTVISNVSISFAYSQRFDNNPRRNFSISQINATIIKSNFWSCVHKSLYANLDGFIYILDTDYYNYAVVLGCGEVGKQGIKIRANIGHMVWVFSRNSQLENIYLAKINQTLMYNNLSLELKRTNQNNCTNIAGSEQRNV